MAIDSTVQLALIAGFVAVVPAIVSPLLLHILSTRSTNKLKQIEADIRSAEKKEDYARQDKVAAAVAAASAAVAANNRIVSESRDATNGKLDVIHTLVNSSMTAAMQAEYDATKREVVMMHEVIELKKAAGQEPRKEALEAIAVTEARIAELRASLDERHKTASLVADQVAAGGVVVSTKEGLETAARGLRDAATAMGKDRLSPQSVQAPAPAPRPAPPLSHGAIPVPVADDRTAKAAERTASASERSASAAEREADVVEKKSEKDEKNNK